LLIDVLAPAIPAEKRPDREAVPEVMHARPRAFARLPQADLVGQPPEDTMNILVQQVTALFGNDSSTRMA
jgi:hypothetical protein